MALQWQVSPMPAKTHAQRATFSPAAQFNPTKPRRKRHIDPRLVEDLARMGCTIAEASKILHCSTARLSPGGTHREPWLNGQADGNRQLRAAQMRVAIEKENPSMLVWLGKQRLSQSDRSEIKTGPTRERIALDQAELQAYRETMAKALGAQLPAPRREVAQSVGLPMTIDCEVVEEG